MVTDLCLSNTAGHIDVGGRIKLANFPNVHSAFTEDAQRLCSYAPAILILIWFVMNAMNDSKKEKKIEQKRRKMKNVNLHTKGINGMNEVYLNSE